MVLNIIQILLSLVDITDNDLVDMDWTTDRVYLQSIYKQLNFLPAYLLTRDEKVSYKGCFNDRWELRGLLSVPSCK